MSAGSTAKGFYESDAGTLHPIRVQPETTEANLGGTTNVFANGTASGVTKSKVSAKVSKGKREKGLGPRTVTVVFGLTPGSFPDGYKPGGITTFPVFVKATWDAMSEADQVTYLGKQVKISYLSPESVK